MSAGQFIKQTVLELLIHGLLLNLRGKYDKSIDVRIIGKEETDTTNQFREKRYRVIETFSDSSQ